MLVIEVGFRLLIVIVVVGCSLRIFVESLLWFVLSFRICGLGMLEISFRVIWVYFLCRLVRVFIWLSILMIFCLILLGILLWLRYFSVLVWN